MRQQSTEEASADAQGAEERRWLLRHREGDGEAFAELLAAYRAPVYAYLCRCGVSREARDDLFQDIFLRIHRAAHTYRPHLPLHPWLFTIVANTVRQHFRRLKVRELVRGSAAEHPEPVDAAPDGARRAEVRETATWVRSGIHRLPPNQRQVLLLVSVQGLALKEVAKALEMPLGTVKTCLRRARLTLTRSLAAWRASQAEAVSEELS